MSSVVDRAARATYHPKGYGTSEGLARARRPFRLVNALTGAVIAGFAVSVYAYSIRAVKQDDFSDVAIPSEGERASTRTIEEELSDKERLKRELVAEFVTGMGGGGTLGQPEVVQVVERQSLVERFAGRGTKLVVGAPPVDKLGRLGGDQVGVVPDRRVV